MNSIQTEADKRLVEQKRSQALRLNEPELRAFEQKLKNACIFKEQQCQIKEKEYEKLRREIELRNEAQRAKTIKINYEKSAKEKRVEALNNKIEYRKELKQQIDACNQKKLQENKMKLQDKEIYEKIQKDIKKERESKLAIKENSIKKLQLERELFTNLKKVSEENEKLISVEEERTNEEYKKYEEYRNKEFQEMIKRKNDLRNEIYEIIAAKMLAQQTAMEERRKLIEEIQEHEHAQNQKVENSDLKLKSFNDNITRILKIQISANKIHHDKLRLEELQYRDYLKKEIEVYNQLEKEEKIMKQLKIYQYALDIHRQIGSNKLKHKNQIEKMKWTDSYIRQYNEKIQSDIENEKTKLTTKYLPFSNKKS